MRIIVDENVHRVVIAGLRADGHEVLSVLETHSGLDDSAVLQWAREEQGLLVTSDRDFGRLLIAAGGSAPQGVIYLRLPRRGVETILDRLRDLLKGDRDFSDHLVVVAPGGERWRPLST